MRTRKPVSSISYNSLSYLTLKLDELIDSKKISFYCFIYHKPEDDEAGKKYHFHLYIEPAVQIQTEELRDHLIEFDPSNPDKPLGCLLFRSSKFDDWCLYALHDKQYLASKGQSRHFHYLYEDLISSNDDDLLFMFRSIDRVSLSPYASMQEAQSQGLTFQEYFRRGTIPLPQITLYERAWYLLRKDSLDRNGRFSHDLDVSSDTGEVISDSILFKEEV